MADSQRCSGRRSYLAGRKAISNLVFLSHATAIAGLYAALVEVGASIGMRFESWLRDEMEWAEWSARLGRARYRRPDSYVEVCLDVDGEVRRTAHIVAGPEGAPLNALPRAASGDGSPCAFRSESMRRSALRVSTRSTSTEESIDRSAISRRAPRTDIHTDSGRAT